MKPVHTFGCRGSGCSALFTGTRGELAEAGWYSGRGAGVRYASCPDHLPEWVPAWRAQKAEEAAYRDKRRRDQLRYDQLAVVRAGDEVYQLHFTWPTAWDATNSLFELAAEKAFELGGGTSGGGIMTGAPLYNSPSDFHAAFPTEQTAFDFIEFLKDWAGKHRHEDCDTRFYRVELKRVHEYTIEL